MVDSDSWMWNSKDCLALCASSRSLSSVSRSKRLRYWKKPSVVVTASGRMTAMVMTAMNSRCR